MDLRSVIGAAAVATAALVLVTGAPAVPARAGLTPQLAAARMVSFLETTASIVDRDQNDCNAMGADLTAFFHTNAAFIADFRRVKSHLTKAQRAEFRARYGARLVAAMQRMKPGLLACYRNRSVETAFASLGSFSQI